MWSRIGPKMGTGVLAVPWVDSPAFVVVAQGVGTKSSDLHSGIYNQQLQSTQIHRDSSENYDSLIFMQNPRRA